MKSSKSSVARTKVAKKTPVKKVAKKAPAKKKAVKKKAKAPSCDMAIIAGAKRDHVEYKAAALADIIGSQIEATGLSYTPLAHGQTVTITVFLCDDTKHQFMLPASR